MRPQPPPAAITLVKGPEAALAERAVAQWKTRMHQVVPDAELVEFSAQSYEGGDLATHTSGSLFTEDKLLVIRDLDKMNAVFAKDFEGYLRSPAPQAWIIALHKGGNRGQRILKALAEMRAPEISAATVKSDHDKADLVVQEVASQGGAISREAAMDLVGALGGDLGELLASARQLVFDSGGNITPETVRTFHRGRVETRPYEVAQALAQRDATQALLLARQAFATKVPPVVIVSALANKFRLLAKAKIPGITAAELKVPSWQLDRARKESHRWSEEALGKAIIAIADADAEVKGESRTPEGAIELCIMEISRAQ